MTFEEDLKSVKVLGTDIKSVQVHNGFKPYHSNYKACVSITSHTFVKTPDDSVQSVEDFFNKFNVEILITPKEKNNGEITNE